MIKRIKQIKNLGIFVDYNSDIGMPEFKRFNLFYGWNGSGKTTLTKFFSSFVDGKSAEYSNLKYKVESESGSYKEGVKYPRQVRVFNQDYVTNNIELLGCKAKPIFVLGEENKAIVKQIEKDEEELYGVSKNPKKPGKINLEKKAQDKFRDYEKRKSDTFTNIAKIIGENTSGATVRNYRKNNAEIEFSKLASKQELSNSDKVNYSRVLRQEQLPVVNVHQLPEITVDKQERKLEKFLSEVNSSCKELCYKTVESEVIDRLKDNGDISEWVEAGLLLHNVHKSKKCEFCNHVIPETRTKELLSHFNKADQKLKLNIDNLLEKFRTVYSLLSKIKFTDKANLYKEHHVGYEKAVKSAIREKELLMKKILEIGELLKIKKSKTTEPVKFNINIDIIELQSKLEDVNSFIALHNKKTENFQKNKDIAQNKLEAHYLSTIYDELKKLDRLKAECRSEINILNDGDISNNIPGINLLKERIEENKSKISSSHKACKELNTGLKTFLGRDELRFEVEGKGYSLKRKDKIAKNLSEGEKTAIAFVYFTVHLKDKDFNKKEGVVVIDDPVSSLDSNSLFQAFAFLKNSIKNVKQVFIFTHNFDFLRLLLNWLRRESSKDYYMIRNKYFPTKEREAYITELDKELKNHESEYHYLYKTLLEFRSDGSIASVYHIPNIARKVLESFLMFRVPSSEGVYQKLQQLQKQTNFDENKITAIYKFVNDQSHITGKGFDPSLVPETQKNVKYLFEMMEKVFPDIV